MSVASLGVTCLPHLQSGAVGGHRLACGGNVVQAINDISRAGANVHNVVVHQRSRWCGLHGVVHGHTHALERVVGLAEEVGLGICAALGHPVNDDTVVTGGTHIRDGDGGERGAKVRCNVLW